MAKKICKGSSEHEDVAHFAIEQFLVHERAQELVDAGKGMQFLSGIIWRSFNSSTSEYHTLYRQKGRMHHITSEEQIEAVDEIYDVNQDLVTGAMLAIIEDMLAGSTETWFRATLFNMYLSNNNYSDLSRKTGIPRTSISQAVEEAKEYIKQQLKLQNITYEL